MDALVIALIVIGLIVTGLERNRRNQTQPRAPLAGADLKTPLHTDPA
jgi:hypothetical protein